MGSDTPKQKTNSHSNKKNIINKIIKNSILPLSAVALFGVTVFYWNNQNYGLALEYQGQTIAKVSNEEIYEKANHMILDQLNSGNKSKIENTTAQLKVAPINKVECCESPTEIKDKIIEKSQEVISEGFGIYVNDKLISVAKNETEINSILNNILDESKSANPQLNVEFKENIKIIKGIFSPEEIKESNEIKKIFTKGFEKFTEYTVSDEDTIIGICEKFNITPEELLLSDDIKDNSISVGDKLTIKTIDKILHVRTFKILNEETEIPYITEKTEDPSKETSFEQTIQEGKNGKETFKYKIEYSGNEEINRTEMEHTIVEKSIPHKIIVGTKKSPEKTGFLWPVPFTKKITSPYGNRSGGFHKGIDIACSGSSGKDILAAEDGTIKSATYSNKGYGNHIIIDHGNGKQTLYAHCKDLFVSVNKKVSKGEKIATIGSTGDSTGPHLHFEIRINNEAKNPEKYL